MGFCVQFTNRNVQDNLAGWIITTIAIRKKSLFKKSLFEKLFRGPQKGDMPYEMMLKHLKRIESFFKSLLIQTKKEEGFIWDNKM